MDLQLMGCGGMEWIAVAGIGTGGERLCVR